MSSFSLPPSAQRPAHWIRQDLRAFLTEKGQTAALAIVPETLKYARAEAFTKGGDEEGPFRVLVVTLNNPKKLNALPVAAHYELSCIFDAYFLVEELLVAVITGAGRAFCAGYDLAEAAAVGKAGGAVGKGIVGQGTSKFVVKQGGEPDGMGIVGGSGFGGLTDRDNQSRHKPVIAAVNGLANGGGFEICLACDVVIAASSAQFALPEPLVGLAAAAGGMVRLPRQIGLQNALAMLLTGRQTSADEGFRLGFVQEVVPPGENVLGAALSFAAQVLRASPDAIQATLSVARRTYAEEMDAVLATKRSNAYPAVQRMQTGLNRIEGPTAFGEKRPPRWVPPVPLAKL